MFAATCGHLTKYLITEICGVHNELAIFKVPNGMPLLKPFVTGRMTTTIQINSALRIHPVRPDFNAVALTLKINGHHVGHQPGRTGWNTSGLWRHHGTVVVIPLLPFLSESP